MIKGYHTGRYFVIRHWTLEIDLTFDIPGTYQLLLIQLLQPRPRRRWRGRL